MFSNFKSFFTKFKNRENNAIFNVHCHFLSFETVPDQIIKKITMIPEILANKTSFRLLMGLFSRIHNKNIKILGGKTTRGKRYDDIRKYLKIMDSKVSKSARKFMARNFEKCCTNSHKLNVCTPLMMDMKQAATKALNEFKNNHIGDIGLTDYELKTLLKEINDDKTLEEIGMKPYREQINTYSGLATDFPFQIFPFIMFDPRRDDSVELCIDALENRGFLGIKMYPPLGYYQSPELNSSATDEEKEIIGDVTKVNENLEKLYSYCAENNVPITTHCGVGGAYDIDMDEDQARKFTNPANWHWVLKNYSINLNFAHFGGDYLLVNGEYLSKKEASKKAYSIKWRNQILEFMKDKKLKGTAYADLSYNDFGLRVETEEKYKKIETLKIEKYFDDLKVFLEDKELKNRILFGTDYPMITHTWSEKTYVSAFKKNLGEHYFKQVANINPISFLFQNNKIPQRYIEFLANTNPNALAKKELPKWLHTKQSGKAEIEYFIV